MICNFCASTIEPGTGIMFVTKDGTIMYFCSSKCEKNRRKLHRRGIRSKWTNKYKKVSGPKGKEESDD